MSLSKTIYCNFLNFNLLQQQKSRIIAIILLIVVTILHVTLALYLLNTPTTETKKPVAMIEVAMLSTSGSAEKKQALEVPPKPPVKIEPVKPKTTVKQVKPLKKPILIKKPAPQPVNIKEVIPVPIFVPSSTTPAPVSSNTVAAPSASTNSTATAKTTKVSGSEQDDNKTVISDVVPLYRVSPDYPQRLKNRHIEGWVKVEFTIQTDGSVDKAEVVSADPENIFDEAALDAINQWKFKEKIVNGVAVTQRAVQRFTFRLTQ